MSEPHLFSPLMLFGDECAINKERNRNILFVEFHSVLCDLPPSLKHLLIFIMRREWLITKTTEWVGYEVTRWSCDALSAGKFPEVDHAGQPLTGWRKQQAGQWLVPGRERGVVVLHVPDWKYAKETFQLQNAYDSANVHRALSVRNNVWAYQNASLSIARCVCHHCHAENSEGLQSYVNCNMDAPWAVGPQRTSAEFRAMLATQHSPCPLLSKQYYRKSFWGICGFYIQLLF